MIVGDLAGSILLGAALITVDGIAGKEARAIHRQQIMTVQIGVGFQHLAALETGKKDLKGRTQRARSHLLDEGAHLRITRSVFHPIQRT